MKLKLLFSIGLLCSNFLTVCAGNQATKKEDLREERLALLAGLGFQMQVPMDNQLLQRPLATQRQQNLFVQQQPQQQQEPIASYQGRSSANELQDQAAREQALLQSIDGDDAFSARPIHSSARQAAPSQYDSSDDLLPFTAPQGSQEQPKGLCARIAACLACLC